MCNSIRLSRHRLTRHFACLVTDFASPRKKISFTSSIISQFKGTFQSVGYCNCLVEAHNYPIHVISKLLITQQLLLRTQQCSQINDIYSQFVKRVGYFLKLKLFKMLKTNRKLKTLSSNEKYEIFKEV